MNKRPTLSDIADKTGLSTATISLILSGKRQERFTPETVRRVHSAARELGYQSKKDNERRKLVMIVCPSVINPYYATMLQGVEMVAEKHHYPTFVYNTYWDQEREDFAVHLALNPLIGGVVFCMAPMSLPQVQNLASKVPVVVVADKESVSNIDAIEINNFGAGKMMGRYLASLGHRHVAYLSTALTNQHPSRLLRLKGLEAAFGEVGGNVDVMDKNIDPMRELSTVEIEHQTGILLVDECLKQHPDVTAMVAINDMVAYGVLDGLAAHEKRVPQDYSVAAFDNIYPSQLAGVRLTTVNHTIFSRGQGALELLMRKMEGSDTGGYSITHVEFKPVLVIRGTTAKPRESD